MHIKHLDKILIILLSTVITVKMTDYVLGAMSVGFDTWDPEAHRRSLIIREHPPGLDVSLAPPKSYLPGTDGLVDKPYRFRTDQNGFISGPKNSTNGSVDIAFVGGSTTECMYVEEDKRFPYLVANKLSNSLNRTIKTINSGVSGNHTFHTMLLVLGKILPLKPKAIVLMENVNDLSLLVLSNSYWKGPQTRMILQNNKDSSDNLFFSILENGFPHLWRRLIAIWPSLRNVDEFSNFRANVAAPVESLTTMFKASLRSWVSVVKAWGVTPVLMTQFNRLEKNDIFVRNHYGRPSNLDYDSLVDYYKQFNDAIRKVASEEGVYLIDLDLLVPKSNEYIYDAVHLNTNGSELVGRIVAKKLEDLDIK